MINKLNTFITFLLLISLLSCKRDKRDAELFFIQGNTAYKKGDFEKSVKYFTESIEKEPSFPDVYNNRGLAYMKIDKLDEAKKDFQKAIELDDAFIMAKYNLAETDFYLNNINESLENLGKIKSKLQDSAYYQVLLGSVYAAKNSFSEATTALNKAISLDSKDSKAYTNLGFVQYQERNYEAAKVNFNKALQLNPKQDFALNNLSLIEAMNENYTQAEALARKAIEINNQSFIYENNLSYYLIQQKKLGEAKSLLEKLERNHGENAWVLRNLGVYNLAIGDNAKAKEYLLEADKTDPSVELINYYLGLVEQKTGGIPCKYWTIGEKIGEIKSAEMKSKFCR